jgi:hypothetical protein
VKLVIVGAAFCCFCVSGCSAFFPPDDAGASKDAATTETSPAEAAACVPDYQACTTTSLCCISSSICNINTGVCQTVCEGIGSICSDSSQCCSGICNGTCE